jgi:hypothetical protein
MSEGDIYEESVPALPDDESDELEPDEVTDDIEAPEADAVEQTLPVPPGDDEYV